MQAMEYLAKGRQALQAGNLQEATHWARQADTLVATYAPNEDSPQRLMHDVAVAASGTQRSVLAAPAAPAPGTYGPAPGGYAAPAAPPVAHAAPMNPNMAPGQPYNPTMAPAPQPPYNPAMAPAAMPPQHDPAAAQANARATGARNKLIVDARVALSQGDVNRATQLANQAGAMQLPYPPKMDTHENVLAHVRNYTFIMQKRQQEGDTEGVRRALAKSFMEQSQTLLGWGRLDEASTLAFAADNLNVKFNQFEPQPRDILARIEAVKNQRGNPSGRPPMTATTPATSAADIPPALAMTPPAEYVTPAGAIGTGAHTASAAVYAPGQDNTAVVPASVNQSPGYALLQQAKVELQQNNREAAKKYVAQAEQYRAELDPATARHLNDLQILLSQPDPNASAAARPGPLANPESESVTFNQLATEMQNLQRKASDMRESDPRGALKLMIDFRQKLEESELQGGQRDMLMRNHDKKTEELQKYINDNEAQIRMAERNQKNLDGAKQDQENLMSKQERLAEMTEEFNRLQKERRFAEAEVVGQRAKQLFPDEPVAIQLEVSGKMHHRMHLNREIRDEKEDGYVKSMLAVDRSSIPFVGEIEYADDWDKISNRRLAAMKKQTRLNERELAIQKALDTPVHPNFAQQPLTSVIDVLAKATGINIHIDEAGLAKEGVNPSDRVSLTTQNEISLASALKLILGGKELDYVIRNEVLLITSKGLKSTDVYEVVYPVADLVIPIPNFSPSSGMGLEGALQNAMTTARGTMSPWQAAMAAPSIGMASRAGSPSINSNIPAGVNAQTTVPVGGSGGGMVGGGGLVQDGASGGAASADFESLMDLIVNTIQKDSWEENGGPGTIAKFPVNLSLVVSQTQEAHEAIANLLEQLRRLQDLQVTIEVRFVTLNDTFFEKIGVDFNVNIPTGTAGAFNSQTYTTADGTTGRVWARNGRSATVGQGTYYQDYSLNTSGPAPISFLQGSSALTTAGALLGGYDASKNFGAQLGFAILSDVEAYLFLEAAQSTERSNVLQAPKVTLFNGQQAFVADTSQTPFVISVTPVVGDFAAALQPVIVVLSEGSFMTVQAVVSADRRYVRLTVVPYFSQIGDVQQFTFTGTSTTKTDSSATGDQDNPNDNTTKTNNTETTRQGTTVQLPTFSYVTVTTTVSVPDGGTVLLGGIKRLSEGRSEAGVPILNKVPFINRLFKNTSIGRETSSLMMVVTPRIIIQEEEEAAIGVTGA